MRAAGICKASEERGTGMFVVGDVAGTAALLEVFTGRCTIELSSGASVF